MATTAVTSHRIYILPTRSWVWLLAVLAAAWYAAVSQNNSAAYLLMFFLSSLVLVTAIHAHFALAGLQVRVERPEPVFAGDLVRVAIEVLNPTQRARLAVEVSPRGHIFHETFHAPLGNLEAESTQTAELTLSTERRGRFEVGRIGLTTVYPLGFFRSWRYEPTDTAYLVYPAPAGLLPLPSGPAVTADAVAGIGGGDDFVGARPYQPGESQRHVDWKAVARGQPLLIKQFSGTGSRRVWLEYDGVAHLADPEARLAQLSRWIVDADNAGFAFGLRLPGFEAEPARGRPHYHRCLGALAQFEDPSSAGRKRA